MANLKIKFIATDEHSQLPSSIRSIHTWTNGMVQELDGRTAGELLSDFPHNFEVVRDEPKPKPALEPEPEPEKAEEGPKHDKAQAGPHKDKGKQ